MAIPVPTIPSSTTSISAVELKPTQNNKSFYLFSGLIEVDGSETTLVSINDIGKRDILLCYSVGSEDESDITSNRIKLYSNGVIVRCDNMESSSSDSGVLNEMKVILPANTSIQITMETADTSMRWCVAAYGYYLEHIR